MKNAFSVLFLVCVTASPAAAQAFANAGQSAARYTVADAVPAKPCESLSSFKGDGIVSIAARVVAATADTPKHCRVIGTITPEVAFEINLPEKWNQRFYMTGNGGLAGDALDTPMNADRAGALTNGFVHARTNTGHDAAKEPSGSFILSNPQKAIDYAYRAVHVTADLAKKVATDYYSKPITFSYWSSCSNGGRQGLLEAQRYPDDFDGIVANAPWADQTGFMVGALWNQKAATESNLTPAKMTMVAARATAKCDEVDGLKDGLIDDPRKCSFDPAKDVPACKAGTDTPDCLTTAQADAVRKIYGGPVSNGKPYFPGYMPGADVALAADFGLAQGILRYLVLDPPQPEYDYLKFDYDKAASTVARWGKLADPKEADLSKFRKSGGKLIMTYGWADQILQPLQGVHYYEAVEKKNKDAAEFARLFMVPGMTHCAGGIGPDRNDAVTAVIDWVEKGQAPSQIIASKVTNNQVVRTRPLCAYPQVARYKGTGSIDDAANFSCVAPK